MAYTIWLTGACNLKCKYCYEGVDKGNNSMTIQTAKQALKFIEKDFDWRSAEKLLVSFHGGEPLLKIDLLQYFVSELKQMYEGKCEVSFATTTNATLLTKEIIDYIVKEKIDISVSIDGTAESHDAMRVYPNGTGSHAVVINNAKMLLSRMAPKPVRVSMVYGSSTVNNLSKNVEYLLKMGFDFIAASIDTFDKEWDENSLLVLEKEILKVKEILKKYPSGHVSVNEQLGYIGKRCKGGIGNKHIYYDGTLFPCVVTGGRKEFSIGDIWKGVNIEKRDKLLAHSCEVHSECGNCDLYGYCRTARCTLENKIITGNFITPNPVGCNYTRIIYRICGIA